MMLYSSSVPRLALLALLAAPAIALAQLPAPPRAFTAGVGVTSADSVTGLGVTLGIDVQKGPLMLTANLVDLIVSGRDTDPYYRDDYGCRNGDNGQFSESGNCSPFGFRFGISGHAAVRIPRTPVFLGGGGRVGEPHPVGFGTIGAQFVRRAGRPLTIRANVGPRFVAGAVTYGVAF